MARVQEEGDNLNHDHVGTEHLLLGLVEEEQDRPAEIFAPLGISAEDVREGVLEVSPMGAENAGLW